MAELRRRTRALRAAAVAAGLTVVAGSATQVVTTMSAPDAVRTATQNVSTANYFPAPLPDWISCYHDTAPFGYSLAEISWASAGPGMKYHVTILRGDNLQEFVQSFYTDATTFRYRGATTTASDRVIVSTVNIASGSTDATRVRSSGAVSHTVYIASRLTTRCSGTPYYDMPNQPWENQMAWTPGVAGASPRAGRMFISMADELDSGALAEALPAQKDPGTLTDVPPPELIPDGSEAGDPATSSDPDADPDSGGSSTPREPEDPGAGNGAAPGDDAAPGDAAEPPPSDPAVPPDEEPGGSTDPTDAPRATAALGAGPITVGAVEARLEDVDGQPEVTVTSGDVEVCTAAVPGATAIENSGGALIVTGSGPYRVVDTATCELS